MFSSVDFSGSSLSDTLAAQYNTLAQCYSVTLSVCVLVLSLYAMVLLCLSVLLQGALCTVFILCFGRKYRPEYWPIALCIYF